MSKAKSEETTPLEVGYAHAAPPVKVVSAAPDKPLSAGDVVKYHVCDCCVAGAPPMAVEEVSPNGREAFCVWFGSDGSFHRQLFPITALRR